MHAAGVEKSKNSAKKSKICQKGSQQTGQADIFDPGKNQTDIHRDTAELKRKVPPVIGTVTQDKSEYILFPDFGCRHEQPCGKEKTSV